MSAVRILEPDRVAATLERMAYELLELSYGHPAITLRGVSIRGQYLATRLAALLQRLSPVQVTLCAPDDAIPAEQPLVLVDDVLYSGQTLLTTLSEITQRAHRLPSIQVAVLIDRGHRRYPVSADVIGVPLVTTLQQYVRVQVDEAATHVEAWLE